jgi:hypothetical protein
MNDEKIYPSGREDDADACWSEGTQAKTKIYIDPSKNVWTRPRMSKSGSGKTSIQCCTIRSPPTCAKYDTSFFQSRHLKHIARLEMIMLSIVFRPDELDSKP